MLKNLIPLFVFVVIWEFCFYFFSQTLALFPSPSSFVGYLVKENFSLGLGPDQQGVYRAVFASVCRVVIGLCLSFFIALISGILICNVQIIRYLLMPIINLLAPIAPIAWLPLALSLFGASNFSAIFIVIIGTYFVLVISTVSTIEQTDKNLLELAQVSAVGKYYTWKSLIIPCVLPNLFRVLRLNLIGAWMSVLAAEMVGLRDGLGTIILIGRESYNPNLILIGMSLIGITGYFAEQSLNKLQKSFLWW